ncbi:unnamed protein product [Cylindrotheca closterium]|uniref:Uncharacterized protein n=1 Tax=Cylindrotheca closterium TaxID=2856 RepID=A0AAD2G3M8_9STRA|nr:unnamed protein product [Cylindrotheca closterium]
METKSSKRSRTSYTRHDGTYEKKLNIEISAKEEEFNTYSSRSARRQRKRAVSRTALHSTAKRTKHCSKDHDSKIDRILGKGLEPQITGNQEERYLEVPVSVMLKTIELYCTSFETKAKKEDFPEPPIMKAIPPQILSSREAGSNTKPVYQDALPTEIKDYRCMTVSSKPQTSLHSTRRYPRNLLKAAVTAQKAKKVASSKLYASELNKLTRWWKTVMCILSITMVVHAICTKQPFEKDCIYVNGGGFGGFWFILGQLYKLHEKNEIKDYVCYSAGCLGAVSIMANRTFDDLFDSALNIQTNWKQGSISRFDAVELFVDDLLGNSNSEFDVAAFSNVHILTSVPKSGGWEVKQNIAEDLEHLKTLLVQTAWIPFITGDHIWHPTTGHMDGGFSRLQHPTCKVHISLPWDWNLLVNTMNINMGKEEGNRYWELGLKYGS